MCHTDLGIARGQYPAPVKKDLVGGHEGVGVVVALGTSGAGATGEVGVGTRVGVKFLGDSCLRCEMCRKGFECRKFFSSFLPFSLTLPERRLCLYTQKNTNQIGADTE